MRLAISHTTRYTFSNPVAHGLQRLRLTPLACRGRPRSSGRSSWKAPGPK
jgi:transglutaminase-like putative cysteine protease